MFKSSFAPNSKAFRNHITLIRRNLEVGGFSVGILFILLISKGGNHGFVLFGWIISRHCLKNLTRSKGSSSGDFWVAWM